MQHKKRKGIFGAATAVLCSLLILSSSALPVFAAQADEAAEVQPSAVTTAVQAETEETTAEATAPVTEETQPVTETAEKTEPSEALPEKDGEALGAVSAPDVRLSNTADGIKLEWAEPDNAKEYLVCGTEAGKNNWQRYTTDKNEYVFGGIDSGKQYFFQVQITFKDGTKSAFSSPRGMTFISVPKLNAVSNTFETDKTLKLNWSAVKGANRYRIAKMKTGASDYEYIDIQTNSFVDKDVQDGNTYRYQIRAMYATRSSGTAYGWWSTSSSAKISVWPAITLSNASNGIKVSWDAVKNTARYFVYCKKPSDTSWTRVVTNNLSYTFTGLEAGQLYYFQLYSDSISGKDGKFSKAKSLVYIEPPKMNAAVYNSASNSVTVSWNSVNGAAKYQIARRPSNASSYEYIFVNGTSYTDKSIPQGKFCSYQVRAISADDVYGFWSNTAVGETFTKPELTMSNTPSGILAQWDKIDNASSYTLYYKEASDSRWSSANTSANTYLVNSPNPGKLYFLQLRYTGKSGGQSPFSDVKSITFTPQTALVSVRTSGKAVYLRWTAAAGADYYVIEKINETTGKKGYIALGNQTEYTDTGAVYEHTSCYRVCGVHRETEWHKVYDNAAGAYSNQIKINPRAFNCVNIGLGEQGQKGYKYCNEINNGKLDEWCAIFSGWVLKQGGYILSEIGYSANVGVWCDNLTGMGKFSVKENYTPVMGDLIIFGKANFRSHIGIVVGVEDGYVTTIEGNAAVPSSYSGEWMANSYVTKYEYALDNSYIYGYGKLTSK